MEWSFFHRFEISCMNHWWKLQLNPDIKYSKTIRFRHILGNAYMIFLFILILQIVLLCLGYVFVMEFNDLWENFEFKIKFLV